MRDIASFEALAGGERRGLGAGLLRSGLRVASWFYAGAVGLRNLRYDLLGSPRSLDIPVISVGNLTVGGTGKTPMALWLCERLVARGYRPAVLSRGYGARSDTPPDELALVTRRCPRAVGVAHPDRYLAGLLAVEELGADAAVLDDGFQHRRLMRDLDIVLVDTTRPFGYGYLLPRGLLRESPAGLRRADLVVLTRCDQADPATVTEVESAIRRWVPQMPVVRAEHRAIGWVDLAGRPMPPPGDRPVAAFAGIARPEPFMAMLRALGCRVVAQRPFPDHHLYAPADREELGRWARAAGAEILATTEKDAVKIGSWKGLEPLPVAVLQVALHLQEEGERILEQCLDEVLGPARPDASPPPAGPGSDRQAPRAKGGIIAGHGFATCLF